MRYSKKAVAATVTLCVSLAAAVGALTWRSGSLFQRSYPAHSAAQSEILLSPESANLPEVLAPAGAVITDYVGAKRCAECHSEIYEKQSRSHMANALARMEQYESRKGPLPVGGVRDAANQIQYDVVRQQGGLWLKATQGSRSAEAPMTYVLGSGANGLSFVRETSNDFQELRLAFFSDTPQWDFTPGQEVVQWASLDLDLDKALGTQRISRGEPRTCLGCHSTLLVQRGGQIDPERSVFGVTCERCHGPGRMHVESVGRGEVSPPRNLSVEREVARVGQTTHDPRVLATVRQIHMCGECHGKGSSPADDLHLAQFQVPALQQSQCYQRSPGKLRCTDCHDPHGNARRGDPMHYVRVCLKCHGREPRRDGAALGEGGSTPPPHSERVCPVNTHDGCVQCHMPRQQPIYRSSFTHHRIGVHSEAQKPVPR